MKIASDIIRGHISTIILAQLEKKDSYGYEISKSIQEKTGYILKDATMYTAFRRLEDDKYISSYWGEGNQAGRRRYYTLTKSGQAILKNLKQEWADSKKVIDQLINMEEKGYD